MNISIDHGKRSKQNAVTLPQKVNFRWRLKHCKATFFCPVDSKMGISISAGKMKIPKK